MEWEYREDMDPLLCLCSSKQTSWKAMPMQKSKKLKKKRGFFLSFDKTMKTKPPALDLSKTSYSVMCEIQKIKIKKFKK